MRKLYNFLKHEIVKKEEGMGTIEVVIILAVLVGMAFLFHAFATGFFESIVDGIDSNTQVDQLFNK